MNAKRSAAASKKLGTPVSIHYLDGALHANRMSKKTLDAMMGAIAEAKPLGQRALKLQARALKVPALHPCDLLAPPPAFPGTHWTCRGGGHLDFLSPSLPCVASASAAAASTPPSLRDSIP